MHHHKRSLVRKKTFEQTNDVVFRSTDKYSIHSKAKIVLLTSMHVYLHTVTYMQNPHIDTPLLSLIFIYLVNPEKIIIIIYYNQFYAPQQSK